MKKKKAGLTSFGKNAEKALKHAVKRVLREHKLKKIPITVWKDGKVHKIPPEKISVV